MGSWYQTCAITHLPIMPDEPVKILFLRENSREHKRNTGPIYNYLPLPLMVDAEYDDYGKIKNSSRHELLLSALEKKVFNKTGEPYSELSIDKLIEANRKCNLRVVNGGRMPGEPDTVPLIPVFIKQGVFQRIMDKHRFGLGRGKTRNDLSSQVEDFVENLKRAVDAKGDQLFFTVNIRDVEPLGNLFDNESINGSFTSPLNFHFELPVAMHDGAHEKVKELVRQALDIIVLNSFFDDARMSYHIPIGAGSQEDSTNAQRLLAESIIEYADKLDHRFDDEFLDSSIAP